MQIKVEQRERRVPFPLSLWFDYFLHRIITHKVHIDLDFIGIDNYTDQLPNDGSLMYRSSIVVRQYGTTYKFVPRRNSPASMKTIKTMAKFLGINKKTILLAALMPLGMMLLGFALTFVCTEFMADANAVGKLFPMFVAGSIFVSIASVAPYIVRYAAPADVKAECSDVFAKRVHVAFGKAITLFIMGLISMISTIVAAEVFALACPYMTAIKVFSTLDSVLGECVAGTMLLAVVLSFLVSTLAKTSKQAEIFTAVVGFVMIIISAVPFIPAISAWVATSGIAPYFIPVFNISIILNNLVNSSADLTNVLICGGVNGVIGIILAVCSMIKYTKDNSIEY